MNISTLANSFYQFHREVYSSIHKAFDPSFVITMPPSSFSNIYALLPAVFYYAGDSKIKMIGCFSGDVFGTDCLNITKGVVVESINGEDPINFFLSFAREYGGYTSEHSQLAWGLAKFHRLRLNEIPIAEELMQQNFTVVLTNNQTHVLTYGFMRHEEGKIDIDKQYSNECRTGSGDRDVKLNVFIIRSFSSNIADELQECIDKCNGNSYPIGILIEDPKISGNSIVAASLHQSIVLHDDTRLIGSFNYLDSQNDFEKIFTLDFLKYFRSISCKSVPFSDMKQFTMKGNYGNVEYERTKNMVFTSENLLNPMSAIRRSYDIIVFSDGLCDGVCGQFVFGLQAIGSAISVAYGYQGEDDKIPRLFQNAAITANQNELNGFEELKSRNINFSIPVFSVYDYIYNETEEMLPVDHLDLYSDFFLDETNYISRGVVSDIDSRIIQAFDSFGLDAQHHLTLFRETCNPNNTRMNLDTTNCRFDALSRKNGGRVCRENGTWSEECIESYCDYNYNMDVKTKECIQNSCINIQTSTTDTELVVYICVIVITVLAVIVVTLILGIFILFMHKQNNKMEYYAF